jgi:hypothetical protein
MNTSLKRWPIYYNIYLTKINEGLASWSTFVLVNDIFEVNNYLIIHLVINILKMDWFYCIQIELVHEISIDHASLVYARTFIVAHLL